MRRWLMLGTLVCVGHALLTSVGQGQTDDSFQKLTRQYLDEFPALSPVSASHLGDHRFDAQLNQVSPEAREASLAFAKRYLRKLEGIDPAKLQAPERVDWELLRHELRSQVFYQQEYRAWEWNPLVYTSLTGDAVYSLMARDFAPIEQRLQNVAARLEQFPRLLKQVRQTLKPNLVPQIHAETAIKQNRGVVTLLRHLVEPNLDKLSTTDAKRLEAAIRAAKEAIDEHQLWLEKELLPLARAEFRVGIELYDKKLAADLNSTLTRQDIMERAQRELTKTRREMFDLSKQVYLKQYPYTKFPESPNQAYQQAIIRAALEMAYADQPPADKILESARASLQTTTDFVREKDLVTIPNDPIEIIAMPEFRRGVSLAYCDSPGPLDAGQKTFYAVSPLPEDWNSTQIDSFLREYNLRSLHNLTVHEAMPGHFLQLAHANRYPSTLRSVLASGVFIEGWAVYTEKVMADEGYYNHDPLMKLIQLKWYLRGIANAVMDQSIHAGKMTRDQAMELMTETTFQEEREAAAKWVRAQLTAAQLSTYFVGVQEHLDLRTAVERRRGNEFRLKDYHDAVLSHGSPPVRYVRQILLGDE